MIKTQSLLYLHAAAKWNGSRIIDNLDGAYCTLDAYLLPAVCATWGGGWKMRPPNLPNPNDISGRKSLELTSNNFGSGELKIGIRVSPSVWIEKIDCLNGVSRFMFHPAYWSAALRWPLRLVRTILILTLDMSTYLLPSYDGRPHIPSYTDPTMNVNMHCFIFIGMEGKFKDRALPLQYFLGPSNKHCFKPSEEPLWYQGSLIISGS